MERKVHDELQRTTQQQTAARGFPVVFFLTEASRKQAGADEADEADADSADETYEADVEQMRQPERSQRTKEKAHFPFNFANCSCLDPRAIQPASAAAQRGVV